MNQVGADGRSREDARGDRIPAALRTAISWLDAKLKVMLGGRAAGPTTTVRRSIFGGSTGRWVRLGGVVVVLWVVVYGLADAYTGEYGGDARAATWMPAAIVLGAVVGAVAFGVFGGAGVRRRMSVGLVVAVVTAVGVVAAGTAGQATGAQRHQRREAALAAAEERPS